MKWHDSSEEINCLHSSQDSELGILKYGLSNKLHTQSNIKIS